MSDLGETTVCPECGISRIHRRSERNRPDREGEGRWRCDDGHTFNEPATRARQSAFTIPGDSIAGQIADPGFAFEDLERAD